MANSRAKLLEYSQAQGITTASYGGLTPILPSRVGDSALAEARKNIANTLDKLAAARGKEVTQNQILLKWLQAKGVVAITFVIFGLFLFNERLIILIGRARRNQD